MRKHFIALAATGLTALVGLAAPAVASAGVGGEPAPGTGVQPTPAANTPHLDFHNDSPVQQIRQIVQCGNTMYAVGTFTEIIQGKQTYSRSNIFSFSATAPFKMTSWAPSVNGIVNSIAFNGSNCSDAYIGGKFSSVNGTTARNIAEIDTTTGNVVTSFGHSANGQVETLQAVNGHILVGGYYTTINNSSSDPYMTSLNPTTGKDDGFVQLNISGNYQFPGVGSNPTRVYNQQLSPDGTLDLVEGDFTSVGGQPRQQIFMLNVSGPSATLTGWTSPEFSQDCWYSEPFYLQAAAWSPDQSTIYVATTGYRPPGSSEPPDSGLCDALAAFPATQTSVDNLWINYSGCDSFYSVAADASTVYAGGHERYSMNPDGCDYLGPGGYNAPGMEGVDPVNGALYLDSTGTVGYYSRARGLGADDMLLTGAGLWIASDNAQGSDSCGGVANHSGICFLPYPSS